MVHMDVTVCGQYFIIVSVSTIVFDKCRKSNNKNVQSITFFGFFLIKRTSRLFFLP